MGIYVGPEIITPSLTTTIKVGEVLRRVQRAPEGVYVGSELVWPTYREAFYWFDADTPGRRTSADGLNWIWDIERPEWVTAFDMVAVRTGGRGFDGTRGFGNNDGNGGRAWGIWNWSGILPLDRKLCQARMGIPGTTGTQQADRSPYPSQFYWQTEPGRGIASPSSADNSGEITPSNPNGASVPTLDAFGRSWPGGTGGARDQLGQPYGGGGGGGQGAPLVGGDRRNGRNGAPGYVALRLRSGPVPEGHTWPENPDWTNPQ